MSLQCSRGEQLNNDAKTASGECTSSILIRALEESSSPKLVSIKTLLHAVVQSARTVVKGTVSQRRFNAQFTEFCRAALVGMTDLEDAVYELEKESNPGRQHELRSIGENHFIKELAAYISSQTDVVGLQYLEHVGLLAITSAKLKQKTTESKGSKRARCEGLRLQGPDSRSPLRKNMGSSPSLVPILELEEVLPPITSRGVKLSSISSLTPWLMPWTLPVPNAHGVALDRVTTERPKSEEFPRQSEEVSVMDICSSSTSVELLRLWDSRELVFSTGAAKIGGSSPNHSWKKASVNEENKTMFFPRKDCGVRACVPSQVISDLVHCGISSLVV